MADGPNTMAKATIADEMKSNFLIAQKVPEQLQIHVITKCSFYKVNSYTTLISDYNKICWTMPDTTICNFKTHCWAVERSIESISSSIAANCSSGMKFQFGNDNVYSWVFTWQLKLIFLQMGILFGVYFIKLGFQYLFQASGFVHTQRLCLRMKSP